MLPFDWKTPFGYLVAWSLEFPANSAVYLAVIPFFSLIFVSTWFFIGTADDMTQELTGFNNDIKTSNGRDHEKMVRHFCRIVQHYTDAKQYVNSEI